MNIGVRMAGHEPSGVLEKKTQKCALRVHFTVEKGISLLGEIQTKIGLFHHIFFQKGCPMTPRLCVVAEAIWV